MFVRTDGRPMRKVDIVEFYKDLSKLVGSETLRITGHSPRVTGAQRMAFAGHSEWVIQMFGRWNSEAVLKYVRAALLGSKGGNLAQTTELGTGAKENDPLDSVRVNIQRIVQELHPT